MNLCQRVAVLLAVAAFGGSALAHDPGLSSVKLRVNGAGVTAELEFALADIDALVDLDSDGDGQVSQAEFAYAKPRLTELAKSALVVKFDSRAAPPMEPALRLDELKNVIMQLSYAGELKSQLVVESEIVKRFKPGHRQLFTMQDARGEPLGERLVSARVNSVTMQVDGALVAPAKNEASHTFTGFLKMGVEHIWTGFDHLLFLLALLLVTGNFIASAKIITSFTLAHSITLALATLRVVEIPGRIVEPLIAVSIVYVGVENLLRRDGPKGRWLLTFAFGLIHGFGFASILREHLPAAGGGVAMPLFSFNLGVELGQIAVAAVALPLIWWLRTKPGFIARGVPACSALVALAGGCWFVERVWLG